MNLNLYGCRGKWLMLDLGVTFADESTPGLDVLMPDPAFIVERKDDLVGIVLTHAHEDHLGAVPDLWPLLRCPVYATPFAASVLARKLHEAGPQDEVPVTVLPLGGSLSLSPFELEFVTMTHSIPEPNAVAIRTPHGVVLHTGDWKIDPEPLIGDVTDEAALRRLGTDGVLAMVCDSTNVFVPGEAGSEAEVRDKLVEVIRHRAGLVAVTCFASNLARVESVAKAAVAADRQPVLVGRALHRMVEAAQENGYLTDFPATVAERDAGWLPRDKVCLICTGSQGEPRAALAVLQAAPAPPAIADWMTLQRGTVMLEDAAMQSEGVSLLEGLLANSTDRDVKIEACRELPQAYQADKKYQEALDVSKRGLTFKPDDVMFINNAAYFLSEGLGNPKDALPYAERAAQLAPNDDRILDTLAGVNWRLGNRDKAMQIEADSFRQARSEADKASRALTLANWRLEAKDKTAASGLLATLREMLSDSPSLGAAFKTKIDDLERAVQGAP